MARPLPAALEPVLAFVNSVDVEAGTDDLAGGPAALADWLTGHGLLSDVVEVSEAEWELALDLRAGLRALALVNNGEPAPLADLRRGDRALAALPLVATADVDTPLRPAPTAPVPRALTDLAGRYLLARATGDWARLRRCPAEDCAWAFWDSSAVGSRRWCTMRVCGNRAKARAYAQRRARR